MRQPAERRADLRGPARRQPHRRVSAWPSSPDRLGVGSPARGHRRGARLRRAAHACLPGRAARRSAARRGRARGARGRPRSCACARYVAGERLLLDFAGSAPQHAGNLNCPLAVTRSACLFAVRVLTDPDIPPSAGAYRPIEVRAPEGTLLNARPGAAVAAGNVETSSRVADLVLAAFGARSARAR